MDFRKVLDPTLLRWAMPRASKTATRTAAATIERGRRLVFQTPTCHTKAFKNQTSMTLFMTLVPRVNEVHEHFVSWIQRLEAFVEETYAPRWFHDGRAPACTSCLRPRGVDEQSLRLMVFDDIQWFGCAGDYLRDPPPAESIQSTAAVVEIAGAWITDSSWGIKLRVVQIRDATGLAGRKRKRNLFLIESSDDEDTVSVATSSYQFVDD